MSSIVASRTRFWRRLFLIYLPIHTNHKQIICFQVLFIPKVTSSKLCLKSCCPCFCSPQHKLVNLVKERTRPPKDQTSRCSAEAFRLHLSKGAKSYMGSTNSARAPFFNLPWKVADAGKVQQLPKHKQLAAVSSQKPLVEAGHTNKIIGSSAKKPLNAKEANTTVGDIAKSGWKGPDWQWVMGQILKRKDIMRKIQEMEEILKMDEVLRPFAERTWRRAMQTRMRIRLKRKTAGKISKNLF